MGNGIVQPQSPRSLQDMLPMMGFQEFTNPLEINNPDTLIGENFRGQKVFEALGKSTRYIFKYSRGAYEKVEVVGEEGLFFSEHSEVSYLLTKIFRPHASEEASAQLINDMKRYGDFDKLKVALIRTLLHQYNGTRPSYFHTQTNLGKLAQLLEIDQTLAKRELGILQIIYKFSTRYTNVPKLITLTYNDLTAGAHIWSDPQAKEIEDIVTGTTTRKDSGRSLFLSKSLETITSIVDSVGHDYAIEGIFHMGDEYLLSVGVKRPSPMPQISEIWKNVTEIDQDLDPYSKVYEEINASSEKIEEFYAPIVKSHEDPPEPLYVEYESVSKVSKPFSMVSTIMKMGMEKHLSKLAEKYPDIDKSCGELLGIDSEDSVGSYLTSEQVDAVMSIQEARKNNKSFLLSDQTGIGKGRILASHARRHIQEGKPVIWFVDNPQISIPDCWRDIIGVGAEKIAKPLILSSSIVKLSDGSRNLNPKKLKEIYFSGKWVSDYNIIFTNYNNLRGQYKTDSKVKWFLNNIPKDCLVLLDECHLALSQESNVGDNIRELLKKIDHNNVIYSSATPFKNYENLDLYFKILPEDYAPTIDRIMEKIIYSLKEGGLTAQECFTTMLLEDGVFIRRDHKLSGIKYITELPPKEVVSYYETLADTFHKLVTEVPLSVLPNMARIDNNLERNLLSDEISDGLRDMFQKQAEIFINGLKSKKAVEISLREISEGRKPVITFHSSNVSLLENYKSNGKEPTYSSFLLEKILDQVERSIRSYLCSRRILNSNKQLAARDENYNNFLNTYIYPILTKEISNVLTDLKIDLDVFISPVDYITDALTEQGYKCGEISSRSLKIVNGEIKNIPTINKRDVVDQFNSGELDVLIFNSAGGTGGSYHSSKEFKDTRPRSIIEIEINPNIIKYVQAQGRINRYGQLHEPRIITLCTGLPYENIVTQQKNKKLRELGAMVNGSRIHPLIDSKCPDLLNSIGGAATKVALKSNSRLSTLIKGEESNQNLTNYKDSAYQNIIKYPHLGYNVVIESLKKSFAISIEDQYNFYNQILTEYKTIVEELDRKKANPLTPSKIEGYMDIKENIVLLDDYTTNEGDQDHCALFKPIRAITAIHTRNEKAIDSEGIISYIMNLNRFSSKESYGTHAKSINNMIDFTISRYLPPGKDRVASIRSVKEGNNGPDLEDMASKFKAYSMFSKFLESFKPGSLIRDKSTLMLVAGISVPYYSYDPERYKLIVIRPGDKAPSVINFSQITWTRNQTSISSGISNKFDRSILEEFDRNVDINKKVPVQIFEDNVIRLIYLCRNKHGNSFSNVVEYTDNEGIKRKGVVVEATKELIKSLPIPVKDNRRLCAYLLSETQKAIKETHKLLKNGHTFESPVRDAKTCVLQLYENFYDTEITRKGIILGTCTKQNYNFQINMLAPPDGGYLAGDDTMISFKSSIVNYIKKTSKKVEGDIVIGKEHTHKGIYTPLSLRLATAFNIILHRIDLEGYSDAYIEGADRDVYNSKEVQAIFNNLEGSYRSTLGMLDELNLKVLFAHTKFKENHDRFKIDRSEHPDPFSN